MRGMILAAGRGSRMGALTSAVPKPLLQAGGKYLIEYAIANFILAGVTEIVINVYYHAEKVKSLLEEGERYGIKILYSEEAERLEVAGGIYQALPLLGKDPFIVMSSDVITDFSLAHLPKEPQGLAHLVLVDNPPFHPLGDFGLCENRVNLQTKPALNFAGIGLYRPELFKDCQPGFLSWAQLLLPAINRGEVTGEYYQGKWHNIGTAEDLRDFNQRAREDSNLRPLASETNTLSS